MHHFFEAITNTSGDSLVGYFARVVDPATLSTITMSADNNGTPIVTVSGVADMCATDEYGNLNFYVAPGTYHLDIYAPNSTSFVLRVANVAMNSAKGDTGDPGPAGPSGGSNNTRTTLAELKAASTSDLSSIYDGNLWFWTLGDFSGTPASSLNRTYVKADSTPLTTGAWVRITDALSPEMFGAKGDSITNDNAAFVLLANAVNALKGASITFGKNKTYLFGVQTFANGNGKGYAYNYNDCLHITGCTKPVLIDMNGSTMKFADGLKFGAFDPVTGLPVAVTAPNFNTNQQAHPGIAMRIDYNTGRVRIYNGVIDGNSPNLNVGGEYGDTGRQVVQYGIYAYNNDDFRADVTVFNSGLDGIACGWTGMTTNTPPKPCSLANSVIRNCGRNNVSVTGSNMFSTDDGFLSINAGMAPNATQPNNIISSSPASCIDIEAESSINRFVIIRGQLIAGLYTNTCFVADSGDSADIYVLARLLAGVVWTSKPRTQFLENRIAGVFRKLYGGQGAPGDNTLIRGLQGGDGPMFGAPQQTGLFMDMIGAGAGVCINSMNITLQATRLDLRNAKLDGRISCAFVIGTEILADGSYLCLMDFADAQNAELIFIDAITNKPATGYTISTSGVAQLGDATIISSGNKIRWDGLSGTAGDYPYLYSRLQTDTATWGALSGTVNKATPYATYVPGSVSATPTQTEVQAIATELQKLSQRYGATEATARAKRIPR